VGGKEQSSGGRNSGGQGTVVWGKEQWGQGTDVWRKEQWVAKNGSVGEGTVGGKEQ
jgi:hypothetical protein